MDTKPNIAAPLGGMDRRWGVNPRFADEVRDMRFNQAHGAWESAGGSRRIILGPDDQQGNPLSPFSAIGAVTSIHYFSQHNGARAWLIYEDSLGDLYQFNPSTAARAASPGDVAVDRAGNSQNNRAVVNAPWQRSQSATWGDYFYIVNGINRPLVFDGYVWDYAGFSSPAGTPSVAVLVTPLANTQNYSGPSPAFKSLSSGLGPYSSTADTDYDCAYRWRVAYRNARGELSPLSEPTETARFTNLGGATDPATMGKHYAYVGLPVGGAEVVSRVLFRTQNIVDSSGNDVLGYSEQFYYHSEIQDNTTRGIVDGVPDSQLGALVDSLQYGVFPRSPKFIVPFKGCMWIATERSTTIYFSRPLHPEMFPPDNAIPLGDANLGAITGFYPSRNALVVFMQRGIWLVKGNPVSGFSADILTRTTGCAAPNTIREVPGVGLVFLGDKGVWALQGTLENEGAPTRVVPLHEPVDDYMARLNRAALIGACAAVYHRDEEYWLCVPEIGSDSNNLVLVFHYQTGQWSYREDFPVSCILETPDHRGHLLYGSWDLTSTSTRGIFVYSVGFPDKNGVAIAPLYRSGWFDCGGGNWRSIRPLMVTVRGGLHGDNTMTIQVHSNRKNSAWPGQAAPSQQFKEDVVPVYDTASYDGEATWQALRPGAIRQDIAAPAQAMVHEVRVSISPEFGKRWITVAGIDVETDRSDPAAKPTAWGEKGGR